MGGWENSVYVTCQASWLAQMIKTMTLSDPMIA